MRFSIICGMALRDYWHERALSLCAVLALATVLAPLLILFGVRNGVISNLQERLLQDPRNLEIVPVGSGKYGKDFFEELRKRPDVGYVVPQTRAIAATIGLLPASEKKGGLPPNPVNVSLIPSGAGDPLTRRFAGNAALKDDEIILTAPAADKLGARAGTILTGRVTRARGITREQAETPLRVKAVLPLSALQKEAAFVPPSLAEDAETYRDGMGVPERGWDGSARGDGERLYPSFRLYAADLDGVASLRDFLGARNIDVYTRAEEIENVKILDRSTTLVFGLICLAAGVGFLASTAKARRRRHPAQAPRARHYPAHGLFRGGHRMFPAGADAVHIRARHGAGLRALRRRRGRHQRPLPPRHGTRRRLPPVVGACRGGCRRRACVVPAGRPAAEPFVRPPFTFRGYPR